jgi:hypothetical protein
LAVGRRRGDIQQCQRRAGGLGVPTPSMPTQVLLLATDREVFHPHEPLES